MVLRAIGKYKDYHSMRVIKELTNSNTFKFSHVSPTEVMKQKDYHEINTTCTFETSQSFVLEKKVDGNFQGN